MGSFYYRTFARVCLLPYIGGTIIHSLRLIYDFRITEIPVEVDWGGERRRHLLHYLRQHLEELRSFNQ